MSRSTISSPPISRIEVNEAVRGETTFRIRFAIDICGPDVELLNDSRLVPGRDKRVGVLVWISATSPPAGVARICIRIYPQDSELKEGGPGIRRWRSPARTGES